MIDFEEILYSVGVETDAHITKDPETNKAYTPTGEIMYLDQLCMQFNYTIDDGEELGVPFIPPKCQTTQKPLDFIYEKYNDVYNLTRYKDDGELLDKI
jgi:predicted RND superfamily exporter protein